MTEIERYLFDANGYIVVPNALTPEQVRDINRLIDQKVEGQQAPQAGSHSFPQVLSWRGPMLDLIDNPRITPYLEEVFGMTFRLDHTYAFNIRPGVKDAGAYTLHGGTGSFDSAYNLRYSVHQGKMFNAEVAVVYQLNDVNEGDGGFGCIPGTHKSNFKIPEEFRDLRKPNPAVKNLTGPAGSAIIFTEALSHGTLQWNGRTHRRTLFYKYTQSCIGLGEMYLDETLKDCPELTRRQRELIEAPNGRGKGRKRIDAFV